MFLKKSISVVFAICILLCACGNSSEPTDTSSPSAHALEEAEHAFSEMMAAFNELRYDDALKYVRTEDAAKFNFSDETQSAFYETMFAHMKTKIESSEQTENGGILLSATVTAPDMMPIFGEIFTRYIDSSIEASEPQSIGSDWRTRNEEILREMTSAENTIMKDTAVSVNMVNDSGSWKVVFDDSLMNAMLGGISEASMAISEALQEGIGLTGTDE
ncbi:MAG: hypothetical protein Q4C12_07105 [Clostridia bacterium]|nr:hypothetical protein [Clostridia bacterium]